MAVFRSAVNHGLQMGPRLVGVATTQAHEHLRELHEIDLVIHIGAQRLALDGLAHGAAVEVPTTHRKPAMQLADAQKLWVTQRGMGRCGWVRTCWRRTIRTPSLLASQSLNTVNKFSRNASLSIWWSTEFGLASGKRRGMMRSCPAHMCDNEPAIRPAHAPPQDTRPVLDRHVYRYQGAVTNQPRIDRRRTRSYHSPTVA